MYIILLLLWVRVDTNYVWNTIVLQQSMLYLFLLDKSYEMPQHRRGQPATSRIEVLARTFYFQSCGRCLV